MHITTFLFFDVRTNLMDFVLPLIHNAQNTCFQIEKTSYDCALYRALLTFFWLIFYQVIHTKYQVTCQINDPK